jgi:flagellar basal-body rod protein FlgC
MSTFGSIGVSGSALRVFRTWMDSVSDNIANVQTAKPTSQAAFQPRSVVAASVEGGGVEVQGIALGDPAGQLRSDPTNPLADADGMVRMPDIDMGDQMVQLMIAQRGYQANLAVVERATNMYQAALQLGKG